MNPSPQGNTITSISFVDTSTGWAVGGGGTVLKTTDGGDSWNAQIPATNTCAGVASYGSGCNLNGVFFRDSSNGFVVGDYGTIWRTSNGGANWTAQALPGALLYAQLRGVHFQTATDAVAIGAGYAFWTNNGGTTWNQATGISTSVSLDAVQMVDATTGYTVGSSSYIYKTIDGGHTWIQQTTPAGLGGNEITSIHFIDANNGFGIAGSKLIRTTNGGANWEAATTDLSGWFNSLTISGNTVVVTGTSGVIVKRDAGTNWTDPINTVAAGMTAASSGTTSQLIASKFPGGSNTGFAAGAAGAIVKTTDTGATWTLKAGANARNYSSASFVDSNTGWMVSREGAIVKTTDGGLTWTDDNSGIPTTAKLQSVHFLDSSTGFAAGYSGSKGVIYKYNSGAWTAATVPSTGVYQIWGIHMTDATHGWAVGRPTRSPSGAAAPTVALKTTDGATWALDNTGLNTNIDLYGVDSSDMNNVWAVGQTTAGKGIAARYVAGVWTSIEKTDASGLVSVDMVNASTGYASGYVSPGTGGSFADGRVYKTIDGGLTWNMPAAFPSTTHHVMASIGFLDVNNGYVTGGEGKTYKTADGGTTWTTESVGTSVSLNTVAAIPGKWSGFTAFLGGGNSAILRAKTCSAGKPELSLHSNPAIYWGSYPDYVSRNLSVDFQLDNSGSNIAYNTQITGAPSTNGVIPIVDVPFAVGDVAASGNQLFTMMYWVPEGVTTFRASIMATADDACGATYTYP